MNNLALTTAIVDMVHSLGLPFSIVEDPKFHRVISLAKFATLNCTPPSCEDVSGPCLDLSYRTLMDKTCQSLENEADTFCLTVFGDGATIKRMPLMDVMAAGAHNPAAVLDIHDCVVAG
jgi:hypothetical protein